METTKLTRAKIYPRCHRRSDHDKGRLGLTDNGLNCFHGYCGMKVLKVCSVNCAESIVVDLRMQLLEDSVGGHALYYNHSTKPKAT